MDKNNEALPQPSKRERELDAALTEAIGQRDKYHEWADILAENIALYFGAYIGEHSSQNCPWVEALEVIESADRPSTKPTAQQPNETAVQAEEPFIFEIMGPDGEQSSGPYKEVTVYLRPAAQEAAREQPVDERKDAEGWKEAAIAWNVCASIHQKYAKGKDALFTTRQADFIKHHKDARNRALAEKGERK